MFSPCKHISSFVWANTTKSTCAYVHEHMCVCVYVLTFNSSRCKLFGVNCRAKLTPTLSRRSGRCHHHLSRPATICPLYLLNVVHLSVCVCVFCSVLHGSTCVQHQHKLTHAPALLNAPVHTSNFYAAALVNGVWVFCTFYMHGFFLVLVL